MVDENLDRGSRALTKLGLSELSGPGDKLDLPGPWKSRVLGPNFHLALVLRVLGRPR